MRTRMHVLIRGYILNQTGKITVLRVIGGVCPKPEISRIRGKIHQQLYAWFLSKNALLHNNSTIMAPCILGDRFLPTT
jgi:hypothetical protein